ncbi:hypothetical protein B0T18DRAFT_422247 [Schizothecium vesticola]|uniref:Uncharacterized protein n=1 Tax=Schizothecium vesticola TaxID=314040 RepID=A0AA40BQI3_9PEZI|nr:hypothetical protein B0T18DRAFT_422247 [Schizothecium vesticola]
MTPTSPLSLAASMSTPSSFHTTKDDSPSTRAYTTGVSSPAEDELPDPKYRQAVQPVDELRSHCQIHLEEELYQPAIHLLDNLLTDGISTAPRSKQPPARVAPPSQLALLATLTIHPLFTSRPTEETFPHIAARALTYLRGVLSLTGPVNACLNQAFDFRQRGSSSSRGSHGGVTSASSRRHGSPMGRRSNSPSTSESDFEGRFANEHSIWRRAPDFWATLGWAFRCAAAHPHRWRHWKVWLDYLVEVLELDWDERLEKDDENDDKNYTMLKESLFAIYLDDLRRDRKKPEKETLRALMAFTDDDQSDNTAYREVFDRELAISTSKNKRKRVETIVDLDNDQFGDYMDSWADDLASSNSDASLPGSPTPRSQPKRRGRGRPPQNLRTPPQPPPRFSHRLRSLPPATLRLFIESHATPLPDFVQISLLRTLADALLPSQRPDPDDVDADANKDHGLSWVMLRACFLPFAATRVTAEDNARVSLVLESMLWFVYAHGEAGGEAGVGEAVERGIRAREAKVAGKRRTATGREGREEAVAREVLERSARSLRVLVQVVGCV